MWYRSALTYRHCPFHSTPEIRDSTGKVGVCCDCSMWLIGGGDGDGDGDDEEGEEEDPSWVVVMKGEMWLAL